LVLFVVCASDANLDDELKATIRTTIRSDLSPRHIPDEIYQIPVVPTTLSGKKLELPVKKILLGAEPDAVASRGALIDTGALDNIARIAAERLKASGRVTLLTPELLSDQ
jgi:acetoacetyl-CoA synthetase